MPLVKIDVIKGRRSPAQLRTLADTIQTVMLQKFKASPKDRYQVNRYPNELRLCASRRLTPAQIITQHEPGEIICEDTGLGFERTDDLVVIQIFQQGRTAEDKQNVFAALAERLEAECGLKGTDLVMSCVENKKEDWSFGMGEAQFMTGTL
jgi:phenylpyruvate tautomerase PptA (4-oxalocrotonate tautomerase family)